MRVPFGVGVLLLVGFACSGNVGSTGDAGAGGGSSSNGGGTASAGGGSTSTGGGSTSQGGGSASTGGGSSATGGGSASTGGGGTPFHPIDGGTCLLPNPPHTAAEQQLLDMPADSWLTIPNTQMMTVCANTSTECEAVLTAWSGGVFDTNHNRLYVFGGGHSDSYDNSVYSFDIGTMTWSRLTDPSDPSLFNMDPLSDGQPVSRHTYDGLHFIAHADRLLAHGGATYNQGNGSNVTWTFDPEAKTWLDQNPTADISSMSCCYESGEYDPKTKLVFIDNTDFFYSYDYDTNTWTKLLDFGYPPLWPRYQIGADKRATVDTKRDLVWFFGSRTYLVYDIASNTAVTDDWVTTGGATFTNASDVGSHTDEIITTGGGEMITANGPGIDYDPVADQIVGWSGGPAWQLDITSKTWTQLSGTGAPTATAMNGTYGRWRYIARTNVFVLVNAIDENVYFYKHSPNCGQ